VNSRWLPLLLAAALLIVFRVIGSVFSETMPNFQPLAALFFCGFLLAPGWRGFAWPAAIYFLTYPLPALLQGRIDWLTPGVMLVSILSFGAMFLLGRKLRPERALPLLGGAVVAALLFHIITNGAAWIGSPLYPKTPLGLWQSLWAGPVGSPIPSWVFLKNLVAANLLFTAVILIARKPFAFPCASATPGLTPSR
jgi:hypothetical protein